MLKRLTLLCKQSNCRNQKEKPTVEGQLQRRWLVDARKKERKRKAMRSQAADDKQGCLGLPGQVATQALFCTFCPSQDVPPFSGVGLVQLRLLFCQPRPHTALQDDQVVQVDQPPLTVKAAPWGLKGWGRGKVGRREGWMDEGTEQPGLPDMQKSVALLFKNKTKQKKIKKSKLLSYFLVPHCNVWAGTIRPNPVKQNLTADNHTTPSH